MARLDFYEGIESWKKPAHIAKTLAAKTYLKALSSLEIIGITGSVGKTLTQNAIVSVLSQKFKTITPDENLDPTFRIPQTILKSKPWHQKLVLEYGVEHPGEMENYLQTAKPKIAVVTAISPTHIKYFGDESGIYAEKVKLVEALSKNSHAVLNADDPNAKKMATHTQAKVWFFGKSAKDGVKVSHVVTTLKGTKFRMHYQGQKASVSWKVLGKHQLTSAYAAATVGIISGLTLKQIAKGLSQTKVPDHRLASIVTKHINLIDDSYNSSPKAAEKALETLKDIGKHKKKILILGEMRDLGDFSQAAHKKLGEKIAKSNINYLVTVGKVAKQISNAAKKNKFKGKILEFPNSKLATKEVKKLVGKNSLILVKGSRHEHLERIVYGLLGKSTKINCYHCGELN